VLISGKSGLGHGMSMFGVSRYNLGYDIEYSKDLILIFGQYSQWEILQLLGVKLNFKD
jgi:hypothetical protein